MRTGFRVGERDEEGFTLIELLVVILIIGILAAIAIPVFLNQRQKGVEASLKSDLRSAATFMESYYVDYAIYPTNVTQMSSDLTFTDNTVVTIVTTGNAPGTYCLTGTNPGTTSVISYDSDRGGLLPPNAACY